MTTPRTTPEPPWLPGSPLTGPDRILLWFAWPIRIASHVFLWATWTYTRSVVTLVLGMAAILLLVWLH